MAEVNEPLEKEWFKLGNKSSFFYDPTQPEGDGKVLLDQLVQLYLTPRVEAALGAKGLLRATKADLEKKPTVDAEQAAAAAKHAAQFVKPAPMLNVQLPELSALSSEIKTAPDDPAAAQLLIQAHGIRQQVLTSAEDEATRIIADAHARSRNIVAQAVEEADAKRAAAEADSNTSNQTDNSNTSSADAGNAAPPRRLAGAAAASAASKANPTAAGTNGNPTPAEAAPNCGSGS